MNFITFTVKVGCYILLINVPASLPCEEWHDAVVDDVEGADVVVLLPQDEEHGVEELGELGEEVPPRRVGHAESLQS